MEVDDLLAERQADAGAAVDVATVQALEDHEYPVGEARLDPDPVVRNSELPHVALLTGRDLGLRSRVLIELYGVADEVLEQSREQRPVPPHARQSGGGDAGPSFSDHLVQVDQGLAVNVVQRHYFELRSVTADPGKSQQVIYERLHAGGPVDGEGDVLPGALVQFGGVAPAEQLAEADDLS